MELSSVDTRTSETRSQVCDRLLDVAERLFAERGCDVRGVEADPRMADVARSHSLAVEVAKFEEWDPGGRLFAHHRRP